jgi:S-adenosylmethionine:tRNA ribosyltransferase-isomerase
MRTEEFDYPLPPSLIAQYPSPQRGESSLMILHRRGGVIEHRAFRDLSDYLNPGDLLVMNDTRVLPARLIGKKETGGKVEMLLIPPTNGTMGEWEVLIKGSGKVRAGTRIQLGQEVYGEVKEVKDGKGRIHFSSQGEVMDLIRKVGRVPLPPYIKREDEPLDRDRYQTVFAAEEGSIAAPTAGLHFTHNLLQLLRDQGVSIAWITLHIGLGTFAPVKARNVDDHTMEAEWVEISEQAGQKIEQTRARGGKVIAVGTTTTRALESFYDGNGGVKCGKGRTSLFIYPPYRFRVIDGLITNFHLPKSTLIMLVSAFAGKDLLAKAYKEAVDKTYRFYSYGDAMLII